MVRLLRKKKKKSYTRNRINVAQMMMMSRCQKANQKSWPRNRNEMERIEREKPCTNIQCDSEYVANELFKKKIAQENWSERKTKQRDPRKRNRRIATETNLIFFQMVYFLWCIVFVFMHSYHAFCAGARLNSKSLMAPICFPAALYCYYTSHWREIFFSVVVLLCSFSLASCKIYVHVGKTYY